MRKACSEVPDLGIDLRLTINDGTESYMYFIPQMSMMIPGDELGLTGSPSCHMAIRKNIIPDDNRVYIGNIFLKNYYTYLD